MDAALILDGANLTVLLGIFWRLGSLRSTVSGLKRRLRVVERRVGVGEDA